MNPPMTQAASEEMETLLDQLNVAAIVAANRGLSCDYDSAAKARAAVLALHATALARAEEAEKDADALKEILLLESRKADAARPAEPPASMREAFEKWWELPGYSVGHKDLAWKAWQAALASRPWNPAPWAVQLPVITQEIADDLYEDHPGVLIEHGIGGYEWTQTAVDFAGMLQGVRQAALASRPTSEPVGVGS